MGQGVQPLQRENGLFSAATFTQEYITLLLALPGRSAPKQGPLKCARDGRSELDYDHFQQLP
jgi:hypothetical protein